MVKYITKKNITKKNITKKNITKKIKEKFIKNIIKYWKKYTNGNIKRDNISYKDDFYLSFDKTDDYKCHIHLILKNFHTNHNTSNNILYIMKKLDASVDKYVHSKVVSISVFSDPEIVVINMIKRYNKFISL